MTVAVWSPALPASLSICPWARCLSVCYSLVSHFGLEYGSECIFLSGHNPSQIQLSLCGAFLEWPSCLTLWTLQISSDLCLENVSLPWALNEADICVLQLSISLFGVVNFELQLCQFWLKVGPTVPDQTHPNLSMIFNFVFKSKSNPWTLMGPVFLGLDNHLLLW